MNRPARALRPARPVRIGPRAAAALVLVTLIGIAAFGWPLLADQQSGLAHSQDAPWLFAALLPLLVAVVVATIADNGMDAKAVAMLGVLAAVGAALRPLGAGTAYLEPMFFLMVLSGRVLGPGFGFVLGSVTMFASALLTGGVGPWMPFQMLAMGWFSLGSRPAARSGADPGPGGAADAGRVRLRGLVRVRHDHEPAGLGDPAGHGPGHLLPPGGAGRREPDAVRRVLPGHLGGLGPGPGRTDRRPDAHARGHPAEGAAAGDSKSCLRPARLLRSGGRDRP